MQQVVIQLINNLAIKIKAHYVILQVLIIVYGAISITQNHKFALH